MNLASRLRRRQRNRTAARDFEALSPVAHVADPVCREPVLKRLLDHLEPVFDGTVPPNAYVWGPPGAGKSAVVTALSMQFRTQPLGSVIHTAARDADPSPGEPAFVYVDARRAGTEFSLYHAVLDAVVDEPVPRRGVTTERLRDRIGEELSGDGRRAVVAVDHLGEPETYPLSWLGETLDGVDAALSWLAVGRAEPARLGDGVPDTCIEIPAYSHHRLAEIVSRRATAGLAGGGIEHAHSDDIAAWAEGNAHDALAALYGAAEHATGAGNAEIESGDVSRAIEGMPDPCVSLARTLTLPPNRQRVLRTLLAVDESDRSSVAGAADAVAREVDLSRGTVKRFLYELADTGFVERVTAGEATDAPGRPPSAVEPRFPTGVFRRLYDRTRAP